MKILLIWVIVMLIPSVLFAQGMTGMQYVGEWSDLYQYEAQDVVSYQGGSYVALAPSVGVCPLCDPLTWAVLVAPGAEGAQGVQGPVGPAGPPGPQADAIGFEISQELCDPQPECPAGQSCVEVYCAVYAITGRLVIK